MPKTPPSFDKKTWPIWNRMQAKLYKHTFMFNVANFFNTCNSIECGISRACLYYWCHHFFCYSLYWWFLFSLINVCDHHKSPDIDQINRLKTNNSSTLDSLIIAFPMCICGNALHLNWNLWHLFTAYLNLNSYNYHSSCVSSAYRLAETLVPFN